MSSRVDAAWEWIKDHSNWVGIPFWIFFAVIMIRSCDDESSPGGATTGGYYQDEYYEDEGNYACPDPYWEPGAGGVMTC